MRPSEEGPTCLLLAEQVCSLQSDRCNKVGLVKNNQLVYCYLVAELRGPKMFRVDWFLLRICLSAYTGPIMQHQMLRPNFWQTKLLPEDTPVSSFGPHLHRWCATIVCVSHTCGVAHHFNISKSCPHILACPRPHVSQTGASSNS